MSGRLTAATLRDWTGEIEAIGERLAVHFSRMEPRQRALGYLRNLLSDVERKNGSVILLDATGVERLRWNFTNAWPSKWTGPSFNATENSVAVETLVITIEELKKA